MRWSPLLWIAFGCTPPPLVHAKPDQLDPRAAEVPVEIYDPTTAGDVIDRASAFAFDGGRIELEQRRDGDDVIQIAHNRYAVPVMMAWQIGPLRNLAPAGPLSGIVELPPASAPNGLGAAVVLTTLQIRDTRAPFLRGFQLHARFGDPAARPRPYAYRLPYRAGKTFSVLQGFHGAFSHRGSNEYAIDFDCPVATQVLATRPGIVIATNAAAQGAGTTAEFLDLDRVNFVLVLHDDGTLGEYMHLAPSGVEVTVGQRIERGDELALSGNTGFSSTPHLHFQVMTAAYDGQAARSFPFQIAVAPNRVEVPVQGRTYPSWE